VCGGSGNSGVPKQDVLVASLLFTTSELLETSDLCGSWEGYSRKCGLINSSRVIGFPKDVFLFVKKELDLKCSCPQTG
jgi:hypothetical protein